MRRNLMAVCMFFLSAFPLLAQEFQIDCQGWSIAFFDPEESNEKGGAIERLVSPSGEILFNSEDGPGLFSWSFAGSRIANLVISQIDEFNYSYHVDGLIDENGEEIPINIKMILLFGKEEILFDLTLTVDEIVCFKDNFSSTIPLDLTARVDFTGATGDTTSYSLYAEVGENFRVPYQNLTKISSDRGTFFIILRNPLNPVMLLTPDFLSIEIIPSFPPNSSRMSRLENLFSIIEPGDSIRSSWGIMPPCTLSASHRSRYSIAAFSPHQRSAEQSILYAFDGIPDVISIWDIPTDSDDTSIPVSANLLSLLDIYPDVKFTWLLVTDTIQKMTNWYWKYWWPPNELVFPDSSIVHGGRYSCRMETPAQPGGDAAHMLTYVAVEPQTDHILKFYYYLQAAEDGNPSLLLTINQGVKSERIFGETIELETDSWKFVEVPFTTLEMGTVVVHFRFSGIADKLYLDDIFCIEENTGRNVLTNPGLENFRPFLMYDPGQEKIWANVRGVYRVATEAPHEYHQWLKAVQDNSSEYPYTSQVGLGSHGLHHTPDSTFARYPEYPKHEFDRYRPYDDSIRFTRIMDDIEAIGLNPSTFSSFLRFPGHRHTETVVRPLFKHNFRIIDQGIFSDGSNFTGRIYRYGKYLWVTNSQSWHDVANPISIPNLKRSLDSGFFTLIGAHFNIFAYPGTPGARTVAVQLLGWLETDYPHLLWVTPDEIANFWDELGSVRQIRQEKYGDVISLSWRGAVKNDETVIIYLQDSRKKVVFCYVDNVSTGWEKRGDRIFIELPDLDEGVHNLEIALHENEILPPISREYWGLKLGSANMLEITHYFSCQTTLRVNIYDILGRTIFERDGITVEIGLQNIQIEIPALPSGSFFVRIFDGDEYVYKKLPVIR